MIRISHVQSFKAAPKKKNKQIPSRKEIQKIEPIAIPINPKKSVKIERIDALGNAIKSGSRNHKVTFKDYISTEDLVTVSDISTERPHKICYTTRNYKCDTHKLYSTFLNRTLNKYIEEERNRDDSFLELETSENEKKDSNIRGNNRNKKDNTDRKCSNCTVF